MAARTEPGTGRQATLLGFLCAVVLFAVVFLFVLPQRQAAENARASLDDAIAQAEEAAEQRDRFLGAGQSLDALVAAAETAGGLLPYLSEEDELNLSLVLPSAVSAALDAAGIPWAGDLAPEPVQVPGQPEDLVGYRITFSAVAPVGLFAGIPAAAAERGLMVTIAGIELATESSDDGATPSTVAEEAAPLTVESTARATVDLVVWFTRTPPVLGLPGPAVTALPVPVPGATTEPATEPAVATDTVPQQDPVPAPVPDTGATAGAEAPETAETTVPAGTAADGTGPQG